MPRHLASSKVATGLKHRTGAELSWAIGSSTSSDTQPAGNWGASLPYNSTDATATSQHFSGAEDWSGTTAAASSLPGPTAVRSGSRFDRHGASRAAFLMGFVPLRQEHGCQCKEGSRSAAKGSGAGRDKAKQGAWQRGWGGGIPGPPPFPCSGRASNTRLWGPARPADEYPQGWRPTASLGSLRPRSVSD